MTRLMRTLGLALGTWGLILAIAPSAGAQYVVYPQVVTPTVTYSYYPATTISAYQPAVSYYAAPAVSFYQPAVSYYQPAAVSYYQPAVSYYQPAVSYYQPAAVSYYQPAGAVTTRSYVGLGIFRPRGVYTQSYYTPGYIAPATSYYRPAFWR